jgi:ribosome biogenesis GTPase / thiamine phosphate phosphatase
MKDHLPKRWVGCDIEEHYLGDERKSSKLERKIASAKDRSKYKKTDKPKRANQELERQKKLSKETFLRGRVLSIMSEGISVEYENEIYLCSLRGLLKKEKSLYKNLVTVGDFVRFEKISPKEGSIADIEPRYSILSRADNLSRRKEQIIAANIDLVLITVSVVSPPLKPSLVDRYIIAAQKGKMEPVIVVNKIDLLENAIDPLILQEKALYEEFLRSYVLAGIRVLSVSVSTGTGLDELTATMKNKASVFSGQSGVGKSSLINAIAHLDLEVGEIVERTQKGSHTTTKAKLLPLDFGGWCIDTPGIKSFGVWNLDKDEIESYFSEIEKEGHDCPFLNCTHQQEEGCAVKKAVEEGKISPLRYESYLSLIENASQKHLRR